MLEKDIGESLCLLSYILFIQLCYGIRFFFYSVTKKKKKLSSFLPNIRILSYTVVDNLFAFGVFLLYFSRFC
jgi:hypothetical protein